jgi:hypothetical protein
MLRPHAAHLRLAALAVALSAGATWGCDRADTTLLAPASVTAADPTSRPMVIPTRPPVESLTLTIEGERSMARLAKALRTTVEELIADNQLASTQLREGMELRIRTTAPQLERYLAQRAARRAREAAKQQAKQRTPK